jgi:AbrB family looped-hinge helix DNA binding protein
LFYYIISKTKNRVRKMMKYKAKISQKGQIAIPKKIRDQLDTDILEIEMKEKQIILRPINSIIEIGGSLNKYSRELINREKKEKTVWENHVKEKFDPS